MDVELKEYVKRIRKLRVDRRMSQMDVAEKLDIDYSTYGKYEQGKIYLTVDRAYQLADIFGVSISELLEGENTAMSTHVAEASSTYARPSRGDVIFQIGGGGKNSPAAERFLDRLGRALSIVEQEGRIDPED